MLECKQLDFSVREGFQSGEVVDLQSFTHKCTHTHTLSKQSQESEIYKKYIM